MFDQAKAPKACPRCKRNAIAMQSVAWVNYVNGEPDTYDIDNLEEARPLEGATCVCLHAECTHAWRIDADGNPIVPYAQEAANG